MSTRRRVPRGVLGGRARRQEPRPELDRARFLTSPLAWVPQLPRDVPSPRRIGVRAFGRPRAPRLSHSGRSALRVSVVALALTEVSEVLPLASSGRCRRVSPAKCLSLRCTSYLRLRQGDVDEIAAKLYNPRCPPPLWRSARPLRSSLIETQLSYVGRFRWPESPP